MSQPSTQVSLWPEGKRFAFTVFDDTDLGTCEKLRSVYALLDKLGFRTTKSCWGKRGDPKSGKYSGETLDDEQYRNWILDLQSKGFEIGWHGATWHTARRREVAEALDRFAEVFGHDPAAATNHTGARESIYWGGHRLTGWRRTVYNLLTCYRNSGKYGGHIEGNDLFWGDICRQRIKYYRNFTFRDINTLKACPFMPYHDPLRPYVNYWFAASDGHDVQTFNHCIGEAEQDRLEEEGGACLMYTHFAMGFSDPRGVNPRFEKLMRRLAKKNGWFVPVGVLLDHLLDRRGPRQITAAKRSGLETRWLWEKIFVGTT